MQGRSFVGLTENFTFLLNFPDNFERLDGKDFWVVWWLQKTSNFTVLISVCYKFFLLCRLQKVQLMLKALQPKFVLVFIDINYIFIFKFLIFIARGDPICATNKFLLFSFLLKLVSRGMEESFQCFKCEFILSFSLLCKSDIMHTKFKRKCRAWDWSQLKCPVPAENLKTQKPEHLEIKGRALDSTQQTSVILRKGRSRLLKE